MCLWQKCFWSFILVLWIDVKIILQKHPILQLLKKIIKDIIYNLLLNLTPSTEFFSWTHIKYVNDNRIRYNYLH